MPDNTPLTSHRRLNGALANRAYVALREAILRMDHLPGALLRKPEICAALGASRQPVNDAIARLAAEGLVEVVPQSATRVSRFSLAEIEEAAFLREALEVAAVRRVAERASPEQLSQLGRNLRLQQLLIDDGDMTGFYQADETFHALLFDFTGYPGLAQAAQETAAKLRRPRILMLPVGERPLLALAEHEVILAALRAGDPVAAEAAMRFHLAQLLGRFAPLQEHYPEYFRNAG